MSVVVPSVQVPGAALNVKKTAVRDGILVHFDYPNSWKGGSTEDWSKEQVERFIVRCLRTDAGHVGEVATYADGTPLVKETKSTKVRFDNINDDGTPVPGRPFHVDVQVIGHGTNDDGSAVEGGLASDITASTGSPAAGSGTNPLGTKTSDVTSDGAAPSSSPAPTIIGGPTFLYDKWTKLTNADPVTIEIHISTTSGFTPSGATKVNEVADVGSVIIKKTAAGADLAYGTTYYVKHVAKDADGAAAASAQASGSMVQIGQTDIGPNSVTSPMIVANTIVAGDIASGTITADRLNVGTLAAISADLGTVTAGTFKTALSGTRIEISSTDADRIKLWGTSLRTEITVSAAGVMAIYGPGASSPGFVLDGNSAQVGWNAIDTVIGGPAGTSSSVTIRGVAIDITAASGGYAGLSNNAQTSFFQAQDVGVSMNGICRIGATGGSTLSFFAVTPVTKRADPGNANGTLADVNSKLNSLLGVMRAYGLI